MTALSSDTDWLKLLAEEVSRAGSIKAVADRLGISRTSVSLALAGRYPAKTTKLELLVLETFQDMVRCPFLDADITREICRGHRCRPMPQSDPAKLRHWGSCRKCGVGKLLAQLDDQRGRPQ
jgi:DNA-binding transcriptional regulator YdaS (Cro superfamily)